MGFSIRGIVKRVYDASVRRRIGTITRVLTAEPVAAITFDDGPDAETTPAVMAFLEKNHARGTFFVVGENAARHPEILHRMHAAGHALGNHSWNHPSMPVIKSKERREQMRACEKEIRPYSGKLFRPPYGDQSLASRLDASLMGFQVVTWSLVAEDWVSVEPESAARRLAGSIRPGSILLFHDNLHTVSDDAPPGKDLQIRILDIFFREVSKSFQFVTVPELLRRGTPVYSYWFQKPNVEYLNRLKGADGRSARRY